MYVLYAPIDHAAACPLNKAPNGSSRSRRRKGVFGAALPCCFCCGALSSPTFALTHATLPACKCREWEWVWVRRKVDTPHAIPTAQEAAAHAGSVVADEGKHFRLVKLPLGSLRLSFGYMSRFEDAWALLNWLKQHYTDRTVDDYVFDDAAGSSLSGSSGSGGGGSTAGAAGAAAEQAQRRAERVRRAIELQGPGWC